MTRAVLLAILLCTPLAAEYESNFGRVILAECDLIVQGVASARRTRVSGGFQVEITVQEVLYGKTELRSVSLLYTDPKLLKDKEAVRALFALKSIASGGYSLVGKPVLTPEGDAESDDKRRVCDEFVKLEAQKADTDRTHAFWDLLIRHVKAGGYQAQNAAVELIFVARNRGSIITEERFAQVQQAREAAGKLLTTQTKDDLRLALQGMVEARIKSLKYKRIRRGKKIQDRKDAADELAELVEAYPRAFLESDASLCEAMRDDTSDQTLRDKLDELAKSITAEVRIREARRKANERDE
jgi:hypothetical protein